MDDDDRTTAIGLARYACEYIDAALVVDNEYAKNHPGDQISPMPAYFLAYHGIELTLKAYLRKAGLTPPELWSRKYGHDLHACYDKAKELGLLNIFKETNEDLSAMHLLVGLNDRHGLRYIRIGMKQFPLWPIVDSLVVRLHQAVAPAVGYRPFQRRYAQARSNDELPNDESLAAQFETIILSLGGASKS